MKLCTDKVVADWLGLTQKRVKQLRDEGVLTEKMPGLYNLRSSVLRYVNYMRTGNRADLNGERALLTKAKREAAERENKVRSGELHSADDIERGIKTLCLNVRSRFLTLPAKLAPTLAAMDGDQARMFDELKKAIDEALEELSNYKIALAEQDGDEEESEPM